ncbi:dihydrolipoyllysine-residue acetyltransferase [Basilea psittacipulmonis]|uniref:dihydrolipoyllysine-residue acetyltransferase n=1 Tax=Basilea psittacipulmonis TaxID=1472345 RepID=UPI0006900224|nr:dihydrolipoyllysine-residue acetyltransferase [Basilea psittacipulmonis]
MSKDILVPDIGDFKDVEVIEVLVSVGDLVKEEQSLITVESDKASMEIPAPAAGKITEVLVKVGDKVSKDSLIMRFESAASEPTMVATAPQPVAAPQVEKQPSEVMAPEVTAVPATVSPTAAFAGIPTSTRGLPFASPSVRKFARELGVDLTQVNGTGNKGRITPDDVRAFVKATLQSAYHHQTSSSSSATVSGSGFKVLDWPKIDFASFGPVESKPLSRIKKISGANLHRNWVMIPHVTNNEDADITDLEELRKTLNKEYEREGVKFTLLAFLIRAVVQALKKFPEFNASLDGDNLVLKKYYNIGFAADTPNGLVVPVIKEADKKSISDLAKETSELAKMARDGKLGPQHMQGGCFTISSLGGIGGTSFTPIVNAPEVAILGVSRSAMKPVWNGKEFVPRLIMPLSLSYDHRVIDGAAAAKFNAYLASLLADFRRVII